MSDPQHHDPAHHDAGRDARVHRRDDGAVHDPEVAAAELTRANRATAVAVAVPTRGYALAPDEGVDHRGPEVRASNGSTGGSLAMYRTVVDGQGPPRHEHRHEDETIVVLDGTMEATCGDDTWRGGPGTVMFMPRGLPHTFRSVDGPATILFLVTPGHLDDVFRLREHADEPSQAMALMQRFF